MICLLFACATPEPGIETVPAEDPQPTYADLRERLEAERTRLASVPRERARAEARTLLTDTVRDGLLPAWFGTPWAFHGTSEVPGEGTIACGYLVSTVLQHTGLRVERFALAQQASEHIVKTFTDEPDIARFRTGDERAVVEHVRAAVDGLWVVGLDNHVGFLVHRGDQVELCHSGYTGEAVVLCSDPLEDPAFQSRYHVVGPVLTDRVVDAWLDGERVRTWLPEVRSR